MCCVLSTCLFTVPPPPPVVLARFQFFSRYSGWGPGQLEAEVLAGAWELAACDLESVLQNHNHPDQPGHFWAEIMSRLRQHSSNSR